MLDRFSRKILDHVTHRRYQPRTTRQLATDLGIDLDNLEQFKDAVEQLIEDGQVVRDDEHTIALPPPGQEMIGVMRLHERGFGFVIPESPTDHGDLFIPPGSTLGAMTGDRVRVSIRRDRGRHGSGKSAYIGKVTEILQRAEKHYVGTLVERNGKYYVQCDGRAVHDPVLIRDPHAKNTKPGDKVVIDLVKYAGSGRELPEGVIIEKLGQSGEPDVETLAIMRAYDLADEFTQAVMDTARTTSRAFNDEIVPDDREDLTQSLICTIDPPDAKDYDDALSITHFDSPQKDGATWEIGIHIADVSHFVKADTPLDVEAKRRGNSTYLPRKVIPMLPELLSNGVCSLQESVNRFAKSCFIRYNDRGEVVSERFARSVIRSAKRLTYLEAQALIEGDLREAHKHARTEAKYPRELTKALQAMDTLAKVIRERRLKRGMIVLGLPEVELIFDDSGRVQDAVPEDNAFTHTLIEMFMVEANEAAARLFDRLNIPMIRRIHPDPDAYGLSDLKTFARVAGFNIPMSPSRQELQNLLDAVRGKPAQFAVHLAVLKTLSKAEYSPEIIGHFALASEHYTHFTSPIRRYPDLIVHRGLDAYLDETTNGQNIGDKKQLAKKLQNDDRLLNEQALETIGRHCSDTEQNSTAAERALRHYLVLELLQNHLGDDFHGTVTGITNNGIFVQLDKYLTDGFVRMQDLPGPAGERWKVNPNTGALTAQRSGRIINLGDQFDVRIANIDLPKRVMDLAIIDKPGANNPSKGKSRNQPPKKKPRSQPRAAGQPPRKTTKARRPKKKRRN